MVEDVKMSIGEQATVHFYGRPGGIVSTPHEIAEAITKLCYRYDLG
jgi:2-oxoglutarate ferredoxin oxidoreductase subunit alpha